MIQFQRFTKRFDEIVAVDSLTLEVGLGEIVALLGPNGSGKTTSLKAVAGLLKPTSGMVLIDGRPAQRPEARGAISFLPQKVSFPDALTGREVVEFYRRLRGLAASRTHETLRMASLNGASDRCLATYSGGMIQRLGLAVAALPQAPVLLLDEPTAALDSAGLSAFYEMAERARSEGNSVLFTSHQLGDVERLADRFAILVGGRLAAIMTAGELSERLLERGLMRLELDRPAKGVLSAIFRIAPEATVKGNELIVAGSAELRARIIEAVRDSGSVIRAVSTEEGHLESLYKELVS